VDSEIAIPRLAWKLGLHDKPEQRSIIEEEFCWFSNLVCRTAGVISLARRVKEKFALNLEKKSSKSRSSVGATVSKCCAGSDRGIYASALLCNSPG
jgi:hypothetical protein